MAASTVDCPHLLSYYFGKASSGTTTIVHVLRLAGLAVDESGVPIIRGACENESRPLPCGECGIVNKRTVEA